MDILGKFSYFIMKMYVEGTHWSNSNEYTQHTIISYKIQKTSLNYPHLLPDLALRLTLNGSNYSEQISMVPKML